MSFTKHQRQQKDHAKLQTNTQTYNKLDNYRVVVFIFVVMEFYAENVRVEVDFS